MCYAVLCYLHFVIWHLGLAFRGLAIFIYSCEVERKDDDELTFACDDGQHEFYSGLFFEISVHVL